MSLTKIPWAIVLKDFISNVQFAVRCWGVTGDKGRERKVAVSSGKW